MAQDMDKNKHQSSNPGNQGNQSSNQGSQNNPGEQLRIEPRPGTGAFIFCSSCSDQRISITKLFPVPGYIAKLSNLWRIQHSLILSW